MLRLTRARCPQGGVPLLSASATSAALSNAAEYPHFGRLCPPDSLQSVAMADAVRRLWPGSRVGVVHCDDTYCRGLADGVEAQLGSVHFRHEVPTLLGEGDDLAEWLDADAHIEQIREKLLESCVGSMDEESVLLLITHEGEKLLKAAAEANPPLDVAWFGSEAIGSDRSLGGGALVHTGNSDIVAVSLQGGRHSGHAKYDAFNASLPEASSSVFTMSEHSNGLSSRFRLTQTVAANSGLRCDLGAGPRAGQRDAERRHARRTR